MGKLVSFFTIGIGLFNVLILLSYQVDWESLEESLENDQQSNPHDMSILGGYSPNSDDGNRDTLAEILHFSYGGAIPWEEFELDIEIDGGPAMSCANPSDDSNSISGAQCVLVEFNGEYRDNGYFDKTERVYVKENGVVLCSSPCNLRVQFILDDVVVHHEQLTQG